MLRGLVSKYKCVSYYSRLNEELIEKIPNGQNMFEYVRIISL